MEAAAAQEQVYPVRGTGAWIDEPGGIVVLLPKRLDPVSRGLRRAAGGPAHLRVALDEVGSRAFLLADGTRTAAQLADALVQELGERAGPRERALQFLGVLARNGVLRLSVQPVEPPAQAAVHSAACMRCGRSFHHAEPPGTRLRCPACRGGLRA